MGELKECVCAMQVVSPRRCGGAGRLVEALRVRRAVKPEQCVAYPHEEFLAHERPFAHAVGQPESLRI